MTKETEEEKQKIVNEQIQKLRQEHYIDEDTYDKISQAQTAFYQDVALRESKKENIYKTGTKAVSQTPIKQEEIKNPNPSEELEVPYVKSATSQQQEKEKSKPQKPKLTEQEIRDRNITWSLSIGVMMLLIGGAVLATSTWDVMEDWMKTGMIALFAGFFFSLAYVTGRLLKISRTAFAFYVLGALFLPIFYSAIGFFEQFGTYLSFYGDGFYLYGAIGSALLIPIYLAFASFLNSRLFIWFANVAITLFGGFFVAWLEVPVDGFYFGMIIFNSVLIMLYRLFHQRGWWTLFTNEFISYVQANLVLSTLFMLLFYSHELVHGFNLLLTAVIYLAMIFVTGRKTYHFVFTLMLLYGAYQVIEFSALIQAGALAYAFLGIIFLLLPYIIKDEHGLKQWFQYTSAAVSGLAFIYISLQGMLIRMEDPSVMLLLAYLLIAGNFIYLSNHVAIQNSFFYYLSAVFLMVAAFEGIWIGQRIFEYDSLLLPLGCAAFLLYILLGCLVRWKFLAVIKSAMRDVSAAVLILSLLGSVAFQYWLDTGIMFLLISTLGIFINIFEDRPFNQKAIFGTWLHPVALGLSVTLFYLAFWGNQLPAYHLGALEPVAQVLAALVVLAASYVWKNRQKKTYHDHALYIAHGFYGVAILSSLPMSNPANDSILSAVIVAGGIGMACLLYLKIDSMVMPYVVSTLSLVTYGMFLYALHDHVTITSTYVNMLQLPAGGALLLAVGAGLKAYNQALTHAYWWTAHIFYPFALIISLLYGDIGVWSAAAAVVIYGVSVWQTTSEWKRKTFLYAGFTSFWVMVTYFMLNLELNSELHYAWLVTSIGLILGWLVVKQTWRKRISYYAAPFSVIGMINFSFVYPFDTWTLLVSIVYAGLVLWLLHRNAWDLFNGIPLLLTFSMLIQYIHTIENGEYLLMLAVGIIVMGAGQLLYQQTYKKVEKKFPVLDWYTIVGFIMFIYLYVLSGPAIWEQVLPGLLIAASIYLQKDRIPGLKNHWITMIAVIYLIEPYYAWLINLELPDLIETECYVLPWIALAVFVKSKAGMEYHNITNYVQWAILVIAALVLMQDALSSNTVNDAILLGSLSILSVLTGIFFRQKAFFFVGVGILILNLFLQTKPFWGAMPWWVYLLAGGAVLIFVASYNEWHKQKTSQGKETALTLLNKKIIARIKQWE